MRTRTTATSASLILSAALLLTSCSSGATTQMWPDAVDPLPALPAGSSFSSSVDDTGPVQDDGSAAFGSLSPDENTPAQRIPQIIERGHVIVGVSQSMNLLGFRDPITGEMAGFEVDLAHEISRDIFGDPNRVDFRYVEGADREQALLNGDVDIAIRSMTQTLARQRNMEFSTPYLAVSPALLTDRNSGITSTADLADKTVCATRNSTSAQYVARDLAHRRLLLAETWPDCLMAMQHDQVDAIFSDSAILSGLRAQDPNTVLIGSAQHTAVYGVAAAAPPRRDTAGLIQQVNSTLERIRSDGTWTRLYQRWLAMLLGPATQPASSYRTDAESATLLQMRKKAQGTGAATTTSTSENRGN